MKKYYLIFYSYEIDIYNSLLKAYLTIFSMVFNNISTVN